MNASSKKIFRDIAHRKVRTVLTILGIAIGVLGFSAINITASQLSSTLAFVSDTAVQPDIRFTTVATNASLANTLQQQPNVQAVQPELTIPTRWAIPSGHYPINIVGLSDFAHVQLNKFDLVTGNLPGPGQIALESSDRSIAQTQVGAQITVDVQGFPQNLTISGLVHTQGRPSSLLLGIALGYMQQSDLDSLFQTCGVNTFFVRLKDNNQTNSTTTHLSRIFNAHHVLITGTITGYNTQVSDTVDGVLGAMRVLALLALVLSVFLVLSTITTLVAEQFKIIGTMKAIGAVRSQVIRHYLALVLLYSLIGTALGLILGIMGGYYLVNYLGSLLDLDIGSLQVPASLVIETLAVGIGTSVLAAVVPIHIGTRITIHQALSSYGLEVRGTGNDTPWLRITRAFFGFFPQTVQFGMRGLFRKRWRALLTISTLAITGAAFLTVQITSYSYSTFLSQVFATYHFDVIVSVPSPQPYSQLQRIISTVPGVAHTENLSWSNVDTDWGTALLTGVQLDTQLYQKQVVAGRWFTSTDQNVALISEDAAIKSGLKVGDTINFHDSLHSDSWHLIGIVSDYSGISPNSFGVLLATIAQVNAFNHIPRDDSRIVMIQSTSSNQSDIDVLGTRVDNALSKAGRLPSESTAHQELLQNETRYDVLFALLYIVTIIIALVGAVSLFSTLATIVQERQREIGILRSMGAVSRNIIQVFSTEALSLGMLAWLLSILIGIPAAYGFVILLGHLLLPVPFAFLPLSLVELLAFILIVATIASIVPVVSSVRVKISQSLHYE